MLVRTLERCVVFSAWCLLFLLWCFQLGCVRPEPVTPGGWIRNSSPQGEDVYAIVRIDQFEKNDQFISENTGKNDPIFEDSFLVGALNDGKEVIFRMNLSKTSKHSSILEEDVVLVVLGVPGETDPRAPAFVGKTSWKWAGTSPNGVLLFRSPTFGGTHLFITPRHDVIVATERFASAIGAQLLREYEIPRATVFPDKKVAIFAGPGLFQPSEATRGRVRPKSALFTIDSSPEVSGVFGNLRISYPDESSAKREYPLLVKDMASSSDGKVDASSMAMMSMFIRPRVSRENVDIEIVVPGFLKALLFHNFRS